MKKVFLTFLFCISLFCINTKKSFAVYDPLSVPNNKIGIHILFPAEMDKAAELVDTNNGDWGYVTIPIQAGDRDLKKWQTFMDRARKLHLIPIIRIATEGDYFDKSTWRKPADDDIVDFANFLSSLNWPVKNRYIIVFNEVNRGDEWQGSADPAEYAKLLSYSVTVFKSKSPDFFIISAGLDNAAATTGASYNEYDYLSLMNQAVPGIFNQIDGLSSHAYPNPGFSTSPSVKNQESIASFSFEQQKVQQMSGKTLPIFITETGWTQEKLGENVIAGYFKDALENAWNDPSIVAVTPFLLTSGTGPYQKFSFIKSNGEKSEIFKTFESLSKTAGKPNLYPEKKVLGDNEPPANLPVKDFSNDKASREGKAIKAFARWMFLGL